MPSLAVKLLLAAALHAAPAGNDARPTASQIFQQARDDFFQFVLETDPHTAIQLGLPVKTANKPNADRTEDLKRLGRLWKTLADLEPRLSELTPGERADWDAITTVVDRSLWQPFEDPDDAVLVPPSILKDHKTQFKDKTGSNQEWIDVSLYLGSLPALFLEAESMARVAMNAKVRRSRWVLEEALGKVSTIEKYYSVSLPAQARSDLGDHPTAARVAKAGQDAADALRRYGDFLRKEVLPGSEDTVVLGERETLRRIRYEQGVKNPEEMLAQLEAESQRLEGAIKAAPDRGRLQRVLDAGKALLTTDAGAVEEYRRNIEKAHVALKTMKALPDYPTRVPTVKSTDFKYTDAAMAYALLPTPFGDAPGGVAVPAPPLRDKLSYYSPEAIKVVGPHEGHHHLQGQLWLQFQNGFPPARWLNYSPLNLEGWSEYMVEKLRRNGYFTESEQAPLLWDQHASVNNALIDLSMHLGKICVHEAEVFLKDSGYTDTDARAMVAHWLKQPLQGASYAAGRLQIQQLRDDYIRRTGATEAQFQERFLREGPIAPEHIRSILLPSDPPTAPNSPPDKKAKPVAK